MAGGVAAAPPLPPARCVGLVVSPPVPLPHLRRPYAIQAVWVTHIVTLGGYLHRSHREQLALPREAYSPSAWWSTMYVNRRGHDVSKPYTSATSATTDTNPIGHALGIVSDNLQGIHARIKLLRNAIEQTEGTADQQQIGGN